MASWPNDANYVMPLPSGPRLLKRLRVLERELRRAGHP